MSRTITVEGEQPTVDTRTLLTTQGSVTAPSLVVPAGVSKIKKILASMSHEGAADNGSALGFLRLNGPAVQDGEQTLVIAGAGNQTVQAGSDAAPAVMNPYIIEDVDLDVMPSDVITIVAEFAGVDIGQCTFGVSLVYG